MNLEDCQVGRQVEYAPSPGHWFRGVIETLPWQLAGGHWVTMLVDMEPGYAVFTGKHGDKATKVYAASLGAMRCVCSNDAKAPPSHLALANSCQRFRDEVLHGIDQFENWQTNAVLELFDSIIGGSL